MAQSQVNRFNLGDNKSTVNEHLDRILQCAVEKNLIVEVNTSTFLCEKDSQRVDDLDMKIKLMESKLAHYKRQKKKAVEIKSNIVKGRNVKDYMFKLLNSSILHLIPDQVLHSILDKCQPGQNGDVFSALDRIHLFSKKESSVKELDCNISDNESIIEQTTDDVVLDKKLKSNKRKRRQPSNPKPSKKSKTTSAMMQILCQQKNEEQKTFYLHSDSTESDTDEQKTTKFEMGDRASDYCRSDDETQMGSDKIREAAISNQESDDKTQMKATTPECKADMYAFGFADRYAFGYRDDETQMKGKGLFSSQSSDNKMEKAATTPECKADRYAFGYADRYAFGYRDDETQMTQMKGKGLTFGMDDRVAISNQESDDETERAATTIENMLS